MHPQSQGIQELLNHRGSQGIQAAADLIMSIVEQDRSQERQKAAAASQASHREYVEDFHKQFRVIQNNYAQRLAQSERELAVIKAKYNDLQNLKKIDEAMLHAVTNERNFLQAKLLEKQNMDYMAGAQASHVSTISELQKYGIMYWGQNSLSFGEPWLQLWNQCVAENHQDKLTPNNRFTPKEMGFLLENFLNQLRTEKECLQSLERHASVLRNENSFLFQLANKDPKLSLMEKKAEIVPDNPLEHGGETQHSLNSSRSSLIICDILIGRNHDDVQDYPYTHIVKRESSPKISTTQNYYGSSHKISGGPS